AVAGQELALTIGGGAAVASHRGDDEGAVAHLLERVDCRAGDLGDRRDPPAAAADGDRASGGHSVADPALEDHPPNGAGDVAQAWLGNGLADACERWKGHPTKSLVGFAGRSSRPLLRGGIARRSAGLTGGNGRCEILLQRPLDRLRSAVKNTIAGALRR